MLSLWWGGFGSLCVDLILMVGDGGLWYWEVVGVWILD